MSDLNDGVAIKDAESLLKICAKCGANILVCSERIAKSLSLETGYRNPDILWVTPEYHEQHHCFILTKEIAENIGGSKVLIILDPEDANFSKAEKIENWAGYLNVKVQGSVIFGG